MTVRPLLFFVSALLLSGLCLNAAAQDLNTLSEEELSAYITQLIVEQQSQLQPQQPVIVQIKSDEALNQKIEMIISQLGELKITNDRLQEKFVVLVTELDTKLLETERRISSSLESKLASKIAEQTEALKVYVREQTNPVRMNLPSIGVFLMATALFLILISRTYNFKGKAVALVSGKEKPKKDLKISFVGEQEAAQQHFNNKERRG